MFYNCLANWNGIVIEPNKQTNDNIGTHLDQSHGWWYQNLMKADSPVLIAGSAQSNFEIGEFVKNVWNPMQTIATPSTGYIKKHGMCKSFDQ